MNMEQGEMATIFGTGEERRRRPLSDTVKTALQLYFTNLGGHNAGSIYQMVIAEVERPMFETVMDYVEGNQSRAAQVLGISRSTLRKKLKQYDLE